MKEGICLKEIILPSLRFLLLFLVVFFPGLCLPDSRIHAEAYHRIVILGDPHIPFSSERFKDPLRQDRILAAKIKVRDDINGWQDVDLVAIVGDLCAETGSVEEYAAVQKYFRHFQAAIAPVTGNHDFGYADRRNMDGKLVRGTAEVKRDKLERFKQVFGLHQLSYTKKLGPYLLIFLSAEMTNSQFLLQYSPQQLEWLKSQLAQNAEKPTLIFTHPPLRDTLTSYNRNANTPHFYSQPHEDLRKLLQESPQVLLWVSGHTHTPPTNENFHSDINQFSQQGWNIHNTDMDRETIWTRSLYLYPNRIVIKTFNHKTEKWLDELEKSISF